MGQGLRLSSYGNVLGASSLDERKADNPKGLGAGIDRRSAAKSQPLDAHTGRSQMTERTEPGMWISPADAKKILFMLGKGASRIRPGEYTALDTLEMVQRLERVVEMDRDDDRG